LGEWLKKINKKDERVHEQLAAIDLVLLKEKRSGKKIKKRWLKLEKLLAVPNRGTAKKGCVMLVEHLKLPKTMTSDRKNE